MANIIAKVADGIATKGLFYFNLSSEVLNRTLSHMCGRWYLPMFLLRDWLLTLMYNAPLMVLMRFWSSLLIRLKFSIVTVWRVVLEWSYIGDGAHSHSSNQHIKKLPGSLQLCRSEYSILQWRFQNRWFWWHPSKMAASVHQHIGSLPILTCIYKGTATTQYHQNTV